MLEENLSHIILKMNEGSDKNSSNLVNKAPDSSASPMATRSQTGSRPTSKRYSDGTPKNVVESSGGGFVGSSLVSEVRPPLVVNDPILHTGVTDCADGDGNIAAESSANGGIGVSDDPCDGGSELIGEDILLADVDVAEYVKELRELEKKMDRSDLAEGTMSASTLSKGHQRRRNKSEESLLSHLAKLCK